MQEPVVKVIARMSPTCGPEVLVGGSVVGRVDVVVVVGIVVVTCHN